MLPVYVLFPTDRVHNAASGQLPFKFLNTLKQNLSW